MKKRTAAAVLASALAGTSLLATPAGADPRRGDILELDCDQLGVVHIVVFSNGGSPGLVVGTNQVFVPYELQVIGTFTPADGSDPVPFTDGFVKRAPRNARTDRCTFHDEGSDEYGSFELDGVVRISYTPTR